VNIVPYEAHHALSLGEIMGEPGLRDHPRFPYWAADREADQPAITLEHDNTPLLCAGITEIRDGVGELWSLFGAEMSRYPKTLVVYSRRIVDAWWNSGDFRRIQALVDDDSQVNRRFIEHLGFSREGTLRRYGPFGQDQNMYARVDT